MTEADARRILLDALLAAVRDVADPACDPAGVARKLAAQFALVSAELSAVRPVRSVEFSVPAVGERGPEPCRCGQEREQPRALPLGCEPDRLF